MHRWLDKRSTPVRVFIIALALLFIFLEWLTRILAGSIQFLIHKFGWTRFEDWLRRLPLWCVAPITLIVVGAYVSFELGQFFFIKKHLYVLAVVMHLLKWAVFPVVSYVWRLYDQRLLEYTWIRWTFNLVMYVHNLVVDWIHEQEFYKTAIEYKNQIKESAKAAFRDLIVSLQAWRKPRSKSRVRVAVRYLRRRRAVR